MLHLRAKIRRRYIIANRAAIISLLSSSSTKLSSSLSNSSTNNSGNNIINSNTTTNSNTVINIGMKDVFQDLDESAEKLRWAQNSLYIEFGDAMLELGNVLYHRMVWETDDILKQKISNQVIEVIRLQFVSPYCLLSRISPNSFSFHSFLRFSLITFSRCTRN